MEILDIATDTYNDSLGNLAATQSLPDVFWSDGVTDAMVNGWALNLDEFYANDPDVQELNDAVKKYSMIDGEHYAFIAYQLPYCVMVNKNVFDRYNVELPSYDWTWEDFVALAEELSHPEDYIFGYGDSCYFEETMPIIREGVGRFGWDGESWNFGSSWLEAVELSLEWADAQIDTTTFMSSDPETIESIIGSDMLPLTGHSALWIFSLFLGGPMLDGTAEAKSGCEFLIYPFPKGGSGYCPAESVWGVICKTTAHPREAWELAKWMTWGKEATILRQHMEAANENQMTVYVPSVTTPEVWEDLVSVCNEKLKPLFTYMDKPFVQVDAVAPGMLMTNVGYYFGDVPGQIRRGEKNPADMVAELNAMANGNRDAWLETWRALKNAQ